MDERKLPSRLDVVRADAGIGDMLSVTPNVCGMLSPLISARWGDLANYG